jgi:hypothetical protein
LSKYNLTRHLYFDATPDDDICHWIYRSQDYQ